MLIELFGKNFGCFRDEFRLSMLATDIDREMERGILRVDVDGESEPLELLRCVAVYGPNASGKSTVLRAASALSFLLSASRRFESDEPLYAYEPFQLAQDREMPSQIGVQAVIERRVYEYSIAFVRDRFTHEHLSEIGPEGRKDLFTREEQDVSGVWKEEAQFKLLSEAFRPNVLLLSIADSIAPTLARGIAVGLRQHLSFYDPTEGRWPQSHGGSVAARTVQDEDFAQWLRQQLRSVDFGVEDYVVQEVTLSPGGRPKSREASSESPQDRKAFRLTLLHSSADGEPVAISYRRESRGTQRFVELAPLLYDLRHGEQFGTIFMDEIDASMHSDLLAEVVRQFNCGLRNSEVRRQLVFALHDTTLIDDAARAAILRRDQVYFTEKDAGGAARLYSLAEFKERNVLNLRRRYRQGRYGAIPSIGNLSS